MGKKEVAIRRFRGGVKEEWKMEEKDEEEHQVEEGGSIR